MSVLISLCSFFRIHSNFIIGLGTLVVTILILVTAFVAGLIANKSLRETKKVRTYQFLSDIISNYSSKEMLLAVQILWDLYKKMATQLGYDPKKDLNCREKSKLDNVLWREYNKIRKADEDKIDYRNLKESEIQVETTLHYYRRIVSNFYELLAAMHDKDVIEKETIFLLWNKETLKIIPKIIIPIEERLFTDLYPRACLPEKFRLMQTLYKACPEKSKTGNVSP